MMPFSVTYGDGEVIAYWVVLVTDGTAIEFAPELYRSRPHAESEARRWAWIVSSDELVDVRQQSSDRFEVGIRDVCIIAAGIRGDSVPQEPWVGAEWTLGSYPMSRAAVFGGRSEAEAWLSSRSDVPGHVLQLEANEWHIAVRHVTGGTEAHAVASRAKYVCES